MLKYENAVVVGDIVRAEDFKPIRDENGNPLPDRPDHYLEGTVVETGVNRNGALGFLMEVECDSGSYEGRRIGEIAFVPYETDLEDILEWTTRVTVLGNVDNIDEDTVDRYDDSMDGDHASALASAGWGTDEDYGDYGNEDY